MDYCCRRMSFYVSLDFFFSVIRISDLVEVLCSIISRLGFTVTAYLALLLHRYNRVLVVRA
jgi:hypothetical protein